MTIKWRWWQGKENGVREAKVSTLPGWTDSDMYVIAVAEAYFEARYEEDIWKFRDACELYDQLE